MSEKPYRIAFYSGYYDSEYVEKLRKGVLRFCEQKNIELLSFEAGEIGYKAKTFNYQKVAIASHVNSNNADGIIFASGTQLQRVTPDELESYLKSFQPLPMVSIGYVFNEIPSIISDSSVGFRAILNNIVKNHKCRKILLMSAGGGSVDGMLRENIFREVLEENGVPVDEDMILQGSFIYRKAFEALEEFEARFPDKKYEAIVALNDDMAYACIDYLQSRQISVPDDVMVTGFDDNKHSAYTIPTLTTVNQNIEEQGYTAAGLLYDQLKKKKTEMLIKVPTTAVFRQSCEFIDDENVASETDEMSAGSEDAIGKVSEWSEKKVQLMQVIHSFANILIDMSLEELRHNIMPYLTSVGIKKAAVVYFRYPVATDLFEYFPLPSEAILLSAFDVSTVYDLNANNLPVMFNPSEGLLPDNIFESLHDMYVASLFRGSIQYGYIIYKIDKYDTVVSGIACTLFATALASAYNETCAEIERKNLEKEYTLASRISVTDDMTGLLNRRGFISLGQKTLEVSQAMRKAGMVLYGDMDGLKIINDYFGHVAGDRAIKAEAKILKEQFRNVDIIGRLGGDEFAVVAPGLTEEKFRILKRNIARSCEEWNRKSKAKFILSITIGGVYYNIDEKNYNITKLLEKADENLYAEKEKKKAFKKKLEAAAKEEKLKAQKRLEKKSHPKK